MGAATAGLLEVTDLVVAYGPVLALDGVSLSVAEGDATCLLGPNGAGKTTLLRAISGLLAFHGGRAIGGQVRFAAEVVTGARAERLVAAGLVQVLEGRRVFANLTVEDNLRAGALRAGARRGGRGWGWGGRGRDVTGGGDTTGGRDTPRGGRARRAATAAANRDRVLALFPPLAARLALPAGLLSGGEQQMLAIARALMGSPRLLLLDEPSLGLAPLAVGGIGAALAEINAAGVALLLVEQSRALARVVTRDGYLIDNGQIRGGRAATADLTADDLVRAAYFGRRPA